MTWPIVHRWMSVLVDGSGVQTTLNSRWGDYTSLNLNPTDDCTLRACPRARR